MTTLAPRSRAFRIAGPVVALLALVPTVWFARTLADVPGMIVLAALVPACLYAAIVVAIDRRAVVGSDRRVPEPWIALVGAVLAGAVVAAYLSHTVNAWLLAFAARLAEGGDARPLAGGFGAPIVEELAKAAVLVVLVGLARGLVDGTLDGIVYGALVGIGFAFTENVVYLTFAVLMGGEAGLWRAVYVRALLGGWNHAAFTATSGAALGWALGPGRPRGRWLVVAIGLALATLQHVVWNAVAASAIQGVLCGPDSPADRAGPRRPLQASS